MLVLENDKMGQINSKLKKIFKNPASLFHLPIYK